MNKRNYLEMVDKVTDNFCDNGWADGYADLPSDHNEIINQLSRNFSKDIIIECVDLYMQGYEVGHFMSYNAENIYDEDGNFKEDEYNVETFSHHTEAKRAVSKKLTLNEGWK